MAIESEPSRPAAVVPMAQTLASFTAFVEAVQAALAPSIEAVTSIARKLAKLFQAHADRQHKGYDRAVRRYRSRSYGRRPAPAAHRRQLIHNGRKPQ